MPGTSNQTYNKVNPLSRNITDSDVSVTSTLAADMGSEFSNVPILILMPFVTCISFLSFLSLNRTKQMPSLSKFLASGLIIFDSVAMTTLMLKEYVVGNDNAFKTLQVIGITAAFLSYYTVALMCFERYVAIARPYAYIRFSRHGQKMALFTWTAFTSIYYVFPLLSCNQDTEAKRSICFKHVIFLCSVVAFSLVFCVCVPSLIGILLVIKRQAQRTCMQKKKILLKGYKSTFSVIICLLSVIIVGGGYLIIQAVFTNEALKRRIFDYLVMFNCVVDSCAYVFWYRECRMTALRMVQCMHPSLQGKVEDMRIKVFNINIAEKRHR